MNGERGHDNRLANKALRYKETPDGYTWYQVEDGITMQLVPEELHEKVKHTGGASMIKEINKQ